MSELKTKLNNNSVLGYINSVEDIQKRNDSLELLSIFESITREKAMMWGTSIIGFGKYHYKSQRSTQEGDWPLIAFSPRKQNISIYITPGFTSLESLLSKLGKHKTSKGCLYIKRLSDINIDILKEILEKSYIEAKSLYLK